MSDIRHYAVVTGAYWGFTLTDGALRMLVLLHFYELGYTPFQLATLFLLYEFFGIVTNLLGGWIGARHGLRQTLLGGLALQIVALALLAQVGTGWALGLSVAYVMVMQALSGIAKDLTKMSSKSAIKLVVPEDAHGTLFRWVAGLTGSKNALKGAGFFLGGLLLALLGFAGALLAMAGGLALVLLAALLLLPRDMGRAKAKVKLTHLLSKSAAINRLSVARLFLFGARDVWFVVGLPVYLYDVLGWGFSEVGAFLALWVIGYGFVQVVAPGLLRAVGLTSPLRATQVVTALLVLLPLAMIAALRQQVDAATVLVGGLALFALLFAMASATHSFLILAYSDREQVALNVGFYYMANAAGRLLGTLLSGWSYQAGGLSACLGGAAGLLLLAGVLSWWLPQPAGDIRIVPGAVPADE